MEVTLVGIVILVNVVQPLKALVSMEVTLVGIFITWVNVVRLVNPVKLVGVPSVVYVNPSSGVVQVQFDNGFVIVTGVLKTNVNKFRINLFAKGVGVVKAALLEFTLVTYKFAVDEILVNAFVPIVNDAVEKMYTLFNIEQPEKAVAAILVTLVGIVILVNPVQL
jgi:hypothetical protein